MKKRIAFNPQEEEMIESFLRIVERLFKLPRLIWIRDLNLIKERTGIKTLGIKHVGCGLKSMNYIWIDPAYHLSRPIMETFETIIHEALHMKYPKHTERQIIILTEKYTGCMDDMPEDGFSCDKKK